MSVISKVRGLWRWDGDDAPVLVSRRSFLFMGGVMAAGAVVPAAFGVPDIEASLAAFYATGSAGGKTAMGIRLEREQRLRLLKLKVMMRDHGQPFGAQGEWLMSPNAYRELTGLDPSRVR